MSDEVNREIVHAHLQERALVESAADAALRTGASVKVTAGLALGRRFTVEIGQRPPSSLAGTVAWSAPVGIGE